MQALPALPRHFGEWIDCFFEGRNRPNALNLGTVSRTIPIPIKRHKIHIPSFLGSNFSTPPRFLADVLLVDVALLELAFRLAAARAFRADGGGFTGPFAGFSSLESIMAFVWDSGVSELRDRFRPFNLQRRRMVSSPKGKRAREGSVLVRPLA